MERPTNEEVWRAVLTGRVRGLRTLQAVYRRLPAAPRCKFCYAPFGAPGSLLVRLAGGKPSPLNRRLCTSCMSKLHKQPGGAELEISVLFADVRGSTALAERTSADEFGRLLARFWGTAARVVDRWDGIVDKFVGDEAVALFIPGFAGADHAARAIAAGRDLLDETGHRSGDPWVPLGVGVHTGRSFVGLIGEGDALDFTAVGDTVNTAARLQSAAAAGELLVSEDAARVGGLDTGPLEHRVLEVRGREQPVGVWVDRVAEGAPAAASAAGA